MLWCVCTQVPLDGMVVHGTAQVSWSHISGEALPVQLQQGKQVPAGTLNHDGLLVVEATKGFQDSTPARIARLTAQAQASSLHQLQLYAAACYNCFQHYNWYGLGASAWCTARHVCY